MACLKLIKICDKTFISFGPYKIGFLRGVARSKKIVKGCDKIKN